MVRKLRPMAAPSDMGNVTLVNTLVSNANMANVAVSNRLAVSFSYGLTRTYHPHHVANCITAQCVQCKHVCHKSEYIDKAQPREHRRALRVEYDGQADDDRSPARAMAQCSALVAARQPAPENNDHFPEEAIWLV